MINLYGGNGTDPELSGRFAVFQMHLGDPYNLPWCSARQIFYGPIWDGTPFFTYDGLWDAWPISTYMSNFLNRVAVPTPVTMELGAEVTGTNRYEFTARTCLEPDATQLNLRIYVVMAEDHYPASPSYSRNTFRAVAPTDTITLAPGECSDYTKELSVIPFTSESNLKIFAWAQEPNSNWPADVYQAAIEVWPFEPLEQDIPGDLNGDGVVNAADLALLLGSWGPVDPCTTPDPADLNEDCVVDAADLALLLGNWG